MAKSAKRTKSARTTKQQYKLPPPLVPSYVDLRDMPPPVDLFIDMAMAQFHLPREEASRLVHETIAQKHEAKGNA